MALAGARRPKVALVAGRDRKENIAQALRLIRDDVRARVAGRVVIKPNLLSETTPLPSTHPDAVRAILEFITPFSPAEVLIAEGATDATRAYRNFGYDRLARDFPVALFDLNTEEREWVEMTIRGLEWEPLSARVSRRLVEADCRISVTLPKVHTTAIVTLSLKNMLSSIARPDRERMHGYGGQARLEGFGGLVVRLLKRDNFFSHTMTALLGHVRRFRNQRKYANPDTPLDARARAFLKTSVVMNHNLVTMGRRVAPHISVIDGLIGMENEGPRHGTPVDFGIAVASTDCIAADALTAFLMGFEPMEIGYLFYADLAGLGTADLAQMEILGEEPARWRRRFRPHSNYPIQRLWKSFDERYRELSAADIATRRYRWA